MNLRYILLILSVSLFVSCSKEDIYEEDQLNALVDVSNLEQTDREIELLQVINEYRTSINLNELTFNKTAYYYAMAHNEEMIIEAEMSHSNFYEREAGIKANAGAKVVAENVAYNFSSAKNVLRAWINSPSHRETLEGNYTHTAIAIKIDANGKAYFTNMFFR